MKVGCDHGIPLSACAECCYAALCRAYETNANLHRRAQKYEGEGMRAPGLIHQLRVHEMVLAERKQQVESLGYAWSLRGYRTKEETMTTEEVKRLVANVNRIQRRHFNAEYRLMYESADEQMRARIDGQEQATRNAWAKHSIAWRAARRWKRLAKTLRATQVSSDPGSKP